MNDHPPVRIMDPTASSTPAATSTGPSGSNLLLLRQQQHYLMDCGGAFDSESCKNTPFVVRKLDAHQRTFRLHTGGTQSAQSSPLPHRRLDKLEGVIRDKPGNNCLGDALIHFRDSNAGEVQNTNSPLISRKFFMDQAQQRNYNGPSGTTTSSSVKKRMGAFFSSPIASRKNVEARANDEIEVCCQSQMAGSPLRYRRRVDSETTTTRQSSSFGNNNMTKSDYSASDMSLMPMRRDNFLFDGGHSPVRSVLGEPGVFASPTRSIASVGGQQQKDKGDQRKKAAVEKDGAGVEGPMTIGSEPDQSIVSGWLKFRDNKRVSGN